MNVNRIDEKLTFSAKVGNMRGMKNIYRCSRLKILGTFAIYGMLIALLSACGDSTLESPEARVKHTLKLIEQAAEKRSLSDFMQHVSESYKDHRGNTKADIARLIQLQYLQHQSIYIFTSIQSLDVAEGLATVELNAAMAANEAQVDSQESSLRADTHRFSIVLRSPDEQQTWLIDSVSWERGGWGGY